MKKWVKRVTACLLFCIIICSLILNFASCAKKADSFTVEEHVQRITERLMKRFNNEDDWLFINETGFNVYPLYDQNDKVNYCLVEVEPEGFMFVRILDERKKIYSCFGISTSMYRVSGIHDKDHTWSPYIKDVTDSQDPPDRDKIWILDENGERIYYSRSPYYVTGNITEKMYFLELDNSIKVCAIKKDGEFINLVSCEKFSIDEWDKQAVLEITFWPSIAYDL